MKDKPRYPRESALLVAQELIGLLGPVCDRIQVAGSLRRGREDVGDVELLLIPRMAVAQIDLLTSGLLNQADPEIDRLVKVGVLAKRRNKHGAYTWGEKNKLATHVESGIPVDLFSTSAECWFNYLVCRTGPAASNARIAVAARERGWQWNPYGVGFSRPREAQGPLVHAVSSEREVFEFVGLEYVEPEQRQ